MVAIIYLAAIEEGAFAFGRKVPTALQAMFPSCTFFDYDNFSEAYIRQYALDIVENSSEIIVIAEIDHAQHTHVFYALCNKLLRKKKEIPVLMRGTDPKLQKMFQAVGKAHFFHLNEEATLLSKAKEVIAKMLNHVAPKR